MAEVNKNQDNRTDTSPKSKNIFRQGADLDKTAERGEVEVSPEGLLGRNPVDKSRDGAQLEEPPPERSPIPDERDEEKVDRLRAPDWRGRQPFPSDKNSIDPRENTPLGTTENKPNE